MTTQIQDRSIGEFARWGFTLGHPDDHVVELYHEGELIARFSQTGATQTSLKEECEKNMDENHPLNSLKGSVSHAG
jgi:hypothetical protein